ncbi:MAG: hypothetical protein JRH20_26675, partial [Deltaproteobacteria bacterium]|nr:hypothetical protein [Deltaproteobacteria bacterium]
MSRLLTAVVLGGLSLPWSAMVQAAGDAHSRSKLLRGCGSCHVGHGKAGSKMLPEAEENFCFRCHGNASTRSQLIRQGLLAPMSNLRDVSRDFRQPHSHPIGRTGIHRANEQLPERDPRTPRHVECADCHKSHRTVRLQRTLRGRRITRRSPLDGRSPEYVLCYRCHSDSANLPRGATNVRQRFSASNPSYHPVESIGPQTAYVPSLRAPLNTSSMISCGDCHGNDRGRGMHGSRYPFMLRLYYSTVPRTPESPQAYALCYSCHDRQRLFSGRGFSEHERHVKRQSISCAVCHTGHGSTDYTHLIQFSPTATGPGVDPATRTRELRYVDKGRGAGECTVACHGWRNN